MEHYTLLAIKTCKRTSGGAYSKIRAHPLPGQGVDPELFVECSRKLRDAYPTGTVFLIWAKVTDREGSAPFLYSYHSWDFTPIPESLAQKWIKEGMLGVGKVYAEVKEIKALGEDFLSDLASIQETNQKL
ncbi:MAG: hypothetical protein IJ233_07390 [Pyramidobacter sp.]|nr:hypothetical protein [Pyramidobacter sp.]